MEDKERRPLQAPGGGEDYHNEEGLLVCGKCGKPKQKSLPPILGGKRPLIVGIPCDCQIRKEREREEAAQRALAERRTAKLRKECFPNSGFYRTCTFAADDGRCPEQSSVCQRFAATFDEDDPSGLLLWGGVGTGKSFLASCIANAVIDLGHSALQTDIGYIVNLLEDSFQGRREHLDRILSFDLLIIEDLGAQRCTEYMMEHVYAVVDGRYKSGKPMVITTNFTLQELSHPRPGSPWCRIFDRVLERCYPVELTGMSRRIENGIRMREAMRRRLGLSPEGASQ